MRVLATNNYDMRASASTDAAVRDGPSHHLWGCDRLEAAGHAVEILEFERHGWLKRLGDRLKLVGNLDQQLRIFRKRRAFDVIYSAHAVSTGLLAALRSLGLFGRPIVAIAYQTPHRRGLFERLYVRRCLGGHDELICMTDGVAEDLETFGVPRAKLSRIDWGPDLAFFDAPHAEFVTERAAAPEHYVFTSGKTSRDYPTLLEAFSGLDQNLVICSSAERGVDRIDSRGRANVVWIDKFLDIRSVIHLYRGCVAVAVSLDPSKISTRNSVGNTSLIDALATGKPTLMTRIDFVAFDIEKEGVGLWIEPGDVEGWRRAVRYLTENPAEAAAMGARARRLAETRFNIGSFSTALEAALRRRASGDRS